MKKTAVVLILNVISLGTIMAQSENKPEGKDKESASISIKYCNEQLKYNFGSIKDFEENAPLIVDEITNEAIKDKENKCNIVVEISLLRASGAITKTIAGSITANYSSITLETKKLNDNLMAAIKQ